MTTSNLMRPICLLMFMCFVCTSWGQQVDSTDTSLERQVTVERAYQPIIQDAGKISFTPQRIEANIERSELVYPLTSTPLHIDENFNRLPAITTKFNPPTPTQGYLQAAIGHANSDFKFGYRMKEKKSIVLDVFATHEGQWGRKAWSNSSLGMNFTKKTSALDVYFNLMGKNVYFTRYGRHYDGANGLTVDKVSQMHPSDKQLIWDASANIGIKSGSGSDFKYMLQTGYEAYIIPQTITEHAIKTQGMFEWSSNDHVVGAKLSVQNSMYSADTLHITDSSLFHSRHAFRIEPYYEFSHKKVSLHIGVNLDFNIGRGQLLSNIENLAFAPSPNVHFEYRIVPEWFALYMKAEGRLSSGMLQGFMDKNPYRAISRGALTNHTSQYNPIDATLGFIIKPADCLLINLYGGYTWINDDAVFLAPSVEELQKDPYTFIDYRYSDWQRWQVGLECTYHYQDIIHIALGGHYYHWINTGIEGKGLEIPLDSYDRPAWDASLDIHANINSKWAVYANNQFIGGSKVLTYTTDSNGNITFNTAQKKAFIDLSLGVEYAFNKWLGFYFELNNYINRKNDIYYGYQTQGINGVIGVEWKF